MSSLIDLIRAGLDDIPGVSIQPFGPEPNHTALLVFTTAKSVTPCVATIKIAGNTVSVHQRKYRRSKQQLRVDLDIASPTFFKDLRALVLQFVKRFERATAIPGDKQIE